ncbi:hypothetical protein MC885_006347 [Smutsia gigantea]|nr:hypothetical protein MC885_006347 [Smutsia gigantea]
MSLQRLAQHSSNGNLVDYCAGPAYSSYPALTGSFPMDDNRRIQMLADTVATLPRGRKQLALTRSSSLGDFSCSQRKLVTVEKHDNGTFGFEIQTNRLLNHNTWSSDMYTMVCKIQEDSPAHYAGLQAGDVLANINGVSTEGFTHKQVVDLIRSSGNLLTIETLNGTMILKRTELEAKMQVLKKKIFPVNGLGSDLCTYRNSACFMVMRLTAQVWKAWTWMNQLCLEPCLGRARP